MPVMGASSVGHGSPRDGAEQAAIIPSTGPGPSVKLTNDAPSLQGARMSRLPRPHAGIMAALMPFVILLLILIALEPSGVLSGG
jgi:hypothetical protein